MSCTLCLSPTPLSLHGVHTQPQSCRAFRLSVVFVAFLKVYNRLYNFPLYKRCACAASRRRTGRWMRRRGRGEGGMTTALLIMQVMRVWGWYLHSLRGLEGWSLHPWPHLYYMYSTLLRCLVTGVNYSMSILSVRLPLSNNVTFQKTGKDR